MSRLTITLGDDRYRVLKQAAAQRGKTISALIEESLDFYGIKSQEDALAIVRRVRDRSSLNERDAMALAVREVRAVRKR